MTYSIDKIETWALMLLLCGGVSARSVCASPTLVQTTFAYTGAFQNFVVPHTGLYEILAFGAQGGFGVSILPGVPVPGGRGAEIGGNLTLTAGEVLQIAVGGTGGNNVTFSSGGGGGGGSFVAGPGSVPLVIAGGGG